MSKKRIPSRSEVEVATWFERDRSHIHIRDKKTQQKTIAEWWDEDAQQMFEDGFFKSGPSLAKSVLDYAESVGLISPYGAVRKNIFLFNNPGNAQRILAENFVKGANSGVASSLYIHGNRIYSYGPHFPIAQRNDDGTILIRHPSKKAPSKTTAGHISLVVNAARQVFSPDSILYDTAGELSAEAKGPAAFSNPGKVRKNVFLFNNPHALFNNNPRELNTVEQAAAAVGLVVGTWAPGDGVTRYRFFLKSGASSYGDYHQGDGLYTALGRKDAMAFVNAYGKGRSARTNPPSAGVHAYRVQHGQEGQVASMLRSAFIWAQAREGEVLTIAQPAIVKRAIQYVKKHGFTPNPLTKDEARSVLSDARGSQMQGEAGTGASRAYWIGHASGQRDIERKFGPYGFMVGPGRVCSNPIVRGDKLPVRLQQEALRRYIYRWTSGNDRRGQIYGYCPHCKTHGGKPSETNIACRQVHPTIPLISDVEWLKTHAFHITKDGRFSEKHNHAEPGYMADEERRNPMTRREAAGEIREIRHARDLERSASPRERQWQQGYKYGVAGSVYRTGPKSARRAVETAVRQNPLLQTIMLANPGSVKTFNEMQDVGKAKYVVNYHDGVKSHRDGSPFFDIAIFSSRTKKDRFVRKLESLGFTRGAFRNPPISQQWDRLTGRQRLQILGFVGFDETANRYVRMPWNLLSGMVKQALEQYWSDSSSSRGTTRRRMAPVGVNPLTRTEAGRIIKSARREIKHGEMFAPGHTRSAMAGKAFGKSQVVSSFGPKSARPAARKITERAQKMAKTVISNPGSLRLPKPGTKMTVSAALELARRIGDRGLIQQCQKALKLQKVANKNSKCVIWKTFPMGSSDKIDSVVALTHYGDSPETMYQPPKGSKKGNHMYRHKWGETGGKRSVPLLASADGKMLLMPLEGKKIASDWLRH